MTATRSRWRRWLWRTLLLLVALRVLLAVALPWLLAVAARTQGLSLAVGDTSLSLSGLSFRAEDVVVRVADDDGPPLLTAHELVVDLSLWRLLAGEPTVVDAALAGGRIVLRRDAGGRWRVPPAWLQPAVVAAAPPPAAAPPAAAPAAAAPLRLPLHIESLRVHDLRVRVEDAAAGRTDEGTLDLDVTDLGHPQHPGTATLRLHVPRWFDALWLTLQVTADGARLAANAAGTLRGVRIAELPLPPELARCLGDVHTLAVDLRGGVTGASSAGRAAPPEFAGELQFDLRGDGETFVTLAAGFGPTTAAPGAAVPFTLAANGERLLGELRLQGAWHPLAGGGGSLDGELSVTQGTLARLRPWLEAHGVDLPAAGLDARARFELETGAALAATLHDLELGAGEDRVSLRRLAVRDVRTDGRGLSIGAVQLEAPAALLRLDAGGGLVAAGVRLAPLPAPADAAQPPPPPGAAPAASWPQLRLGEFSWRGGRIGVRDERTTPPAELWFADCDLLAAGLTIGAEAPPGRVQFVASLPGTIAELRAEATLTPGPQALAAELQFAANGITAASIAPWLAAAGLQPQLRDGTLRGSAAARLRPAGDGFALDLDLANVRFADGAAVHASLRRIAGAALHLGRDQLDLGGWTLDELLVGVHREADGGLQIAGFRLVPSASTPPPPAAPDSAPAPAAPAPALRRGPLTVRGAGVRLTSAGAAEPVLLSLDADLGPDDGSGAPTPFAATLALPGGIERLHVDGTLAAAAGAVELTVAGEGVRGTGLQRWLPPGVRCSLTDGTVAARLKARSGSTDVGPAIHLTELRLTDLGQELMALDRLLLTLRASAPGVVHVANLEATGLRAMVASTDDGLLLPGILLSATPSAPPSPAPADTPADTTADRPSRAPAAAPAVPVPATASAPASLRLPTLAIDALAVGIDRIELRERRAVDGEPLVLTGRLELEPWRPQPDAPSPAAARLSLAMHAAPLCADLRAAIAINPYDLSPTADVALDARGLDFSAIQRVLPSLAARVQGTAAAAEFTAKLHARLDLKRRDPHRIDLDRPFGGELVLEHVALRTADGVVLGQLDSLDVVARALDLGSGDVLLRSVRLDGARLAATRTTDGLELLGLRLLQPTAPPADAMPPPPAAPPGDGPPAAEFAVDRFEVQGLAFDFTDATTTPPTVLPLAEADVEVLRLSTRARTQALPVGFAVSLRGGDVLLDRRVQSSSLLAGVLGSAVDVVAGAGDRNRQEPRPLFDEIRVDGQLTLAPNPRGRVRAEVVAFELPAVRGLAKGAGVDVGDGVWNQFLEIELRGADGLELASNSVFTSLSLSEPPGGPISTYLRLPAPLDSVLFLLRNDADEHRLPIRVQLPTAAVSRGAVLDAAAEAVARLVASAVAGAAGRTASALTGVFGFGGQRDVPAVRAEIVFPAGDPLSGDGELVAVAAALADDESLTAVLAHELGAGDVERAAALATPPPDVVATAVADLRARRDELCRERTPLAAEVAALYSAGRTQEARARQQTLAAHDDRLGELEQTLDAAVRIVAGDTPRARQRRTQAAAQALGQARLALVERRLRQQLPDLEPGRVLRRPAAGTPADDLPEGGRVVVTLRRRSAMQDLPAAALPPGTPRGIDRGRIQWSDPRR